MEAWHVGVGGVDHEQVDSLFAESRKIPQIRQPAIECAQARQTVELVQLLGENTVLGWRCSVESLHRMGGVVINLASLLTGGMPSEPLILHD